MEIKLLAKRSRLPVIAWNFVQLIRHVNGHIFRDLVAVLAIVFFIPMPWAKIRWDSGVIGILWPMLNRTSRLEMGLNGICVSLLRQYSPLVYTTYLEWFDKLPQRKLSYVPRIARDGVFDVWAQLFRSVNCYVAQSCPSLSWYCSTVHLPLPPFLCQNGIYLLCWLVSILVVSWAIAFLTIPISLLCKSTIRIYR